MPLKYYQLGILKYCDEKFTYQTTTTIGIDMRQKTLIIDDQTIKLTIWDTVGQEKFRSTTNNTFKGAHGFLLCYDISQRSTFENIESWIKSIIENVGLDGHNIHIIGNKSDLKERQVSLEDGQNLAAKYGFLFSETSAKENINIDDAFTNLTQQVLKRFQKSQQKQSTVLNSQVKPKSGCC
ncbi:hypothetical protein pb186bvf_019547 [Paramecium bursaria]